MKSLKLFITILVAAGAALNVSGQNTFPSSGSAGIGTTNPSPSSVLEMKSTTQGVLVPRMTKNQRDAITSPATGLLVFQTNSTPGFYYWDGAAWSSVSSGANTTLSNLGTTSINKTLLPNATGTLNIGSDALRWKNVYVTNIKFADGTTQSTAGGGGGSLGGSGTANYLPKFTGTATLGNSLLQDDGSKMYVGPNSFWSFAKMNIEQSTHDYTLNLINAKTGSGTTQGIYNIIYGTGGSTGSKTGIRNEISGDNSATGYVMGTDNSIANSGTGISYGTRNFLSGTGNGIDYGTYSQFTSGGSGALYGDYYDFTGVTGSGAQYGTYMNVNSTGTVYGSYYNMTGGGTITGSYINMPTSSGTTKYGLRVNAASTSGLTYGIHSSVATSNPSAYAGYFDGQVKCTDKVGIGVSSSLTVKLQIDGGADAELASGGYVVVGHTNTTNIAIDGNEIMARDDGGVSKLHLNNDGGDVSMCYTGGNVMIGASAPATGYLLTVDGKVICEELKVQLSQDWPDYVFDETYNLPSISELKAFVKANKHLPGIPSASEINGGISVGEMQTKLIEKVEELSLYIIQLQDQIDELKQAKN